jgi:hypothetical protein
MVRIIYHMLSNGVSYQELGPDYLPRKEKNVDYWVQKIQQLGYKVELQELKETG